MKTYKPTLLYFIKIFGLIVFVLFSIFIISLFFDIIAYFLKSSWYELAVIILVNILFLVGSYFTIISNNPIIKFRDTYVIIGNQDIKYAEIEDFFSSKGGSEPYIMTSGGSRIDLQLSWFRKKDRIEIENTLKEKITALKKPS
ncbi:hypothetical protein [Aquimarina sp. MMG016]|uniref:hypothetical protein n=1 Tax=Aquimarina sp. MMG016 TaxID=2822690 RepID=UPI001B39DBCD|nr:hypothetical protein [Aquimarina sp. MMG016]MBQ4818915.1 hypothetical protein [Aquimarina sp. MMG016]